jgi:hypothetical protein
MDLLESDGLDLFSRIFSFESDGADLLFGDWAIQKHAGGSYADSDSHAGRDQVFHFHLSSISRLHSPASSAVGREHNQPNQQYARRWLWPL